MSQPQNTATSAAAASAAASPSIADSIPKKKLDASCLKCARLVQEILGNPDSRPRQVLQSLVNGMTASSSSTSNIEQPSFRLKPVEDGVQVEMRIPDKPYELPQRWAKVAPSASNKNHNPQPSLMAPVLATSSSAPSPRAQNYVTETIQIECRPCETVGPEKGARALIMGPTPLSIVACTNRLTPGDKDEMSQVLVHELLHAYDVKRLNLDFTDCESMAYSEVRAAREAECYSGQTSRLAPTFLKEYCVKQKAIAATHNLFPSRGRQCVRAVFEAAYKDPRPFSGEELQNYVQKTFVPQQPAPKSFSTSSVRGGETRSFGTSSSCPPSSSR